MHGDVKAATLVLKARRPEVYANVAPALQTELVDQLFAHLRDRLPSETFQAVVRACESQKRMVTITPLCNHLRGGFMKRTLVFLTLLISACG